MTPATGIEAGSFPYLRSGSGNDRPVAPPIAIRVAAVAAREDQTLLDPVRKPAAAELADVGERAVGPPERLALLIDHDRRVSALLPGIVGVRLQRLDIEGQHVLRLPRHSRLIRIRRIQRDDQG